jgi:hypothetical protein
MISRASARLNIPSPTPDAQRRSFTVEVVLVHRVRLVNVAVARRVTKSGPLRPLSVGFRDITSRRLSEGASKPSISAGRGKSLSNPTKWSIVSHTTGPISVPAIMKSPIGYNLSGEPWVSVPCTPFNQLPPSLQRIPTYVGGGESLIPGYLDGGVNAYGTMPGIQTTDPNGLKFGQVDTTVVNIAPSTPTQPAEADNCFNTEPGFCSAVATTSNTFSIQLNTNPFGAPIGPPSFPNGPATDAGWVPGDQGRVQFGLQSDGTTNTFSVCLWQNDFTPGKDVHGCVQQRVHTHMCRVGRSSKLCNTRPRPRITRRRLGGRVRVLGCQWQRP